MNVVNKMLGREVVKEKFKKKLHSDKCSCNKCMSKDKYSHDQAILVAGTPVSLNRP